jgi:transcriptional regulator with XRE-family HTH domain
MINQDIMSISREVSIKAKVAGITQESISEALSISQSQVSRLLSGRCKRRTKLLDEICIYVNNQIKGVSPDLVRQNEELLHAIASIWDGSASQAGLIANVIRSLGPICAASKSTRPNVERAVNS